MPYTWILYSVERDHLGIFGSCSEREARKVAEQLGLQDHIDATRVLVRVLTGGLNYELLPTIQERTTLDALFAHTAVMKVLLSLQGGDARLRVDVAALVDLMGERFHETRVGAAADEAKMRGFEFFPALLTHGRRFQNPGEGSRYVLFNPEEVEALLREVEEILVDRESGGAEPLEYGMIDRFRPWLREVVANGEWLYGAEREA